MTETSALYVQGILLGLALPLALLYIWLESPRRLKRLPKPRRHRLNAFDLFLMVFFQIIVMAVAGYFFPVDKAGGGAYYFSFFLCQLMTAAVILTVVHKRFRGGMGALFERTSWKTAGIGLLLFIPAIGLTWLTLSAVQCLYAVPKHDFLEALTHNDSVWAKLMIFISPAVGAPIMEELLFRGVLQNFLIYFLADSQYALPAFAQATPGPRLPIRRGNVWLGIVITAAIFAVFHGNWQHWPPLFVLALILGYSYQKYRNLLVPMIIHAGFNSITLILNLLTNGGST
jgi:membrane protease YdiL (CAAX protease family)